MYYFDSEGKPLTGKKIIDGKEYYFRENGSARRGTLISLVQGHIMTRKQGLQSIKLVSSKLVMDTGVTLTTRAKSYSISKILMANSTILKILEPSITLQDISLKTKSLVLRLKTMIDTGQQILLKLLNQNLTLIITLMPTQVLP